LVKAEVGDTIRFVPTDKGHNAESIKGMLPDGAEPFKGKFGKEVMITVEKEGVYGVKCSPHYSMGMVALIKVGEGSNTEKAAAAKHPGKAGKNFAELFGQVVASQ
jgi:pseudoazurin